MRRELWFDCGPVHQELAWVNKLNVHVKFACAFGCDRLTVFDHGRDSSPLDANSSLIFWITGCPEAKKQLLNLQKARREELAPFFIPISERQRLHDKIDPSLQEYLNG